MTCRPGWPTRPAVGRTSRQRRRTPRRPTAAIRGWWPPRPCPAALAAATVVRRAPRRTRQVRAMRRPAAAGARRRQSRRRPRERPAQPARLARLVRPGGLGRHQEPADRRHRRERHPEVGHRLWAVEDRRPEYGEDTRGERRRRPAALPEPRPVRRDEAGAGEQRQICPDRPEVIRHQQHRRHQRRDPPGARRGEERRRQPPADLADVDRLVPTRAGCASSARTAAPRRPLPPPIAGGLSGTLAHAHAATRCAISKPGGGQAVTVNAGLHLPTRSPSEFAVTTAHASLADREPTCAAPRFCLVTSVRQAVDNGSG